MTTIHRAFEGEPKTELAYFNGQPFITVMAEHLSPAKVQDADARAKDWSWAIMGVSIIYAFVDYQYLAGCGVLFALGAMSRMPLQEVFRENSRQTTTVRFSEHAFEMMNGGVWTAYDRHHPHRFIVLEHDKARAENDELEYQRQCATLNNQPKRIQRYYSDSYIVAFEYLGQRLDIAEVQGRKKANAFVARLTLCDEFMDGLANSRRIPLQPADEWQDQTGGLPS
jgi:hypothetical protein